MGWKIELGKDNRGSRPRSVLLTDGRPEQVAERLARIVGRREVAFLPEDQWQPRGKPAVREAQLDKQLKDGAVLLSSGMRQQMKEWWLVDDGHGRAKTVTWNIASTCTVSGKKGLLLVEAKAHSGELKKDDRCGAQGVNQRKIEVALDRSRQWGVMPCWPGPFRAKACRRQRAVYDIDNGNSLRNRLILLTFRAGRSTETKGSHVQQGETREEYGRVVRNTLFCSEYGRMRRIHRQFGAHQLLQKHSYARTDYISTEYLVSRCFYNPNRTTRQGGSSSGDRRVSCSDTTKNHT